MFQYRVGTGYNRFFVFILIFKVLRVFQTFVLLRGDDTITIIIKKHRILEQNSPMIKIYKKYPIIQILSVQSKIVLQLYVFWTFLYF